MKILFNDYSWNDGSISYARRPYFQLRGKRITEEQAFEIIRHTDFLFYGTSLDFREYDENCEEYIGSCCLLNSWFDRSKRGWVHPNGIVGTNYHSSVKYPDLEDIIEEFDNYLKYFPFLDLVIAFTGFNEYPVSISNISYTERKKVIYTQPEDFFKNVESGVWVHDNMFIQLNKEDTIELYKEYDQKYGETDSRIYCEDYYKDFQRDIVDMNYLKRCIAAYGVKDVDRFIKEERIYRYIENLK